MKYKNGEIVTAKVTGIEEYGIFITLEDGYSGLIHISEITQGFVSNITDFVKNGDEINVYILEVDNKTKHLKLSIKNINYKFNDENVKVKESFKGFLPLYEKLDQWTEEKLKEIE